MENVTGAGLLGTRPIQSHRSLQAQGPAKLSWMWPPSWNFKYFLNQGPFLSTLHWGRMLCSWMWPLVIKGRHFWGTKRCIPGARRTRLDLGNWPVTSCTNLAPIFSSTDMSIGSLGSLTENIPGSRSRWFAGWVKVTLLNGQGGLYRYLFLGLQKWVWE